MLGSFGMAPPTLEKYVPLDKDLEPASIVADEALGEFYNYGRTNQNLAI
jgi:hypothetical protein